MPFGFIGHCTYVVHINSHRYTHIHINSKSKREGRLVGEGKDKRRLAWEEHGLRSLSDWFYPRALKQSKATGLLPAYLSIQQMLLVSTGVGKAPNIFQEQYNL